MHFCIPRHLNFFNRGLWQRFFSAVSAKASLWKEGVKSETLLTQAQCPNLSVFITLSLSTPTLSPGSRKLPGFFFFFLVSLNKTRHTWDDPAYVLIHQVFQWCALQWEKWNSGELVPFLVLTSYFTFAVIGGFSMISIFPHDCFNWLLWQLSSLSSSSELLTDICTFLVIVYMLWPD